MWGLVALGEIDEIGPYYVCCGVPWHSHMQYDVCVGVWLMALDPRGAKDLWTFGEIGGTGEI